VISLDKYFATKLM